jgi:hypothetical protein
MRFIIGFFFFGFLFYLIYIFFPDAFQTLVSWAAHVYEFFRSLAITLHERISPTKPTNDDVNHAMAFLFNK